MKRFLCTAALLVLVTGCGNANNNTSNNTTNTAGQTTNQTAVGTGNTNTTAPSPSTNTTTPSGSQGTGGGTNTQTTQSQSVYAKGIVDMYVRTKNAKTLPEYQVMANQIFIPGMASVVGSMARSGVDYNHPIQSYTVRVDNVTPISDQAFFAKVAVHVSYKDGTKQDSVYHVRFLQGGPLDYMIQTIS